jgi:hypothetical protein
MTLEVLFELTQKSRAIHAIKSLKPADTLPILGVDAVAETARGNKIPDSEGYYYCCMESEKKILY